MLNNEFNLRCFKVLIQKNAEISFSILTYVLFCFKLLL